MKKELANRITQVGMIYSLAFALLGLNFSASANISDGSSGAFELNAPLTLSVAGGTTFNFTTFSILAGGVLDFTGATADDTISILATGDVLINGTLNAFPFMLRIETPGSITINGWLNFNNGLFLTASNIGIYGPITNAGSDVQVFNGSPDRPLTIDGELSRFPVPEPETYGMLLVGLCLLGLMTRRRRSARV